MYTYHLTYKPKANRKVTVATVETDNGICLAVAQKFFRAMNAKLNLWDGCESVSFTNPTSEKIWKGYAENCQHFTLAQFNEWYTVYDAECKAYLAQYDEPVKKSTMEMSASELLKFVDNLKK